MAIELLPLSDDEHPKKPDEKSDIWAFGMVVYVRLCKFESHYEITHANYPIRVRNYLAGSHHTGTNLTISSLSWPSTTVPFQ